MSKRPADFDWKRSQAHLYLLGFFIKPRNTAQVIDWLFLPPMLGESTRDAIDRFVRDEALVPCEIEDCVCIAFTAARLKKMLKEHGLKTSGSKEELIDRLIEYDRDAVQGMVSHLSILRCSPEAQALAESYKATAQSELDKIKQQTFEALLLNDVQKAYKLNQAFCRSYTSFSSLEYQGGAEWLNFILSSKPKILGKISSSNWDLLHAAAAMSQLWYGESALSWLPDDFSTNVKNAEVAVNYVLCTARFARMAAALPKNEKVKVIFDFDDMDSCESCRALAGKEFYARDLPELPLPSCTSDQGCKCRLGSIYEPGLLFDIIDSREDSDASDTTSSGAIERLHYLKKLLDADLITQGDYDTKKAEILSQL